jgi:hypothetical protein
VTCGQRDGDIELNLETDTGRARIVARTLVEKCWIARSQANGRGAPGAAVPCELQRSRSGESWCRRLDLKAVSVALGMIFQRCNWTRALRKADTHGEAAVGHGVGGNGGAPCAVAMAQTMGESESVPSSKLRSTTPTARLPHGVHSARSPELLLACREVVGQFPAGRAAVLCRRGLPSPVG